MNKSVVPRRARAFGARSDISARSLIITVYGDAVRPRGAGMWLGDLVDLLAPFGVNDRLVRTSLYRLGEDGWVEPQRIGRRSFYRLTDFAHGEFDAADPRIYAAAEPDWDGTWLLVLLGRSELDPTDEARLREHLGWMGFGEVAGNVLGHPLADEASVVETLDRTGLGGRVVVVRSETVAGAGIEGAALTSSGFGLDEVDDEYRRLTTNYRWLDETADALEPGDALAARLMLVHELRRARLHDPQLPAELLPADWSGHDAFHTAAARYGRLVPASELFLEELFGTAGAASSTPTPISWRPDA